MDIILLEYYDKEISTVKITKPKDYQELLNQVTNLYIYQIIMNIHFR